MAKKTVGRYDILLEAQTEKFARELDKATKANKRMAKGMRNSRKQAKGLGVSIRSIKLPVAKFAAFGASVFGVSKIMRDLVGNARDDQQAVARLGAALENAGQGSDAMTASLVARADAFDRVSMATQTEIVNAQALFLSMGAPVEMLDKAVEASLDLAAAMGWDLEQAARNIGKTFGGMAGELGETVPALAEMSKAAKQAGGAVGAVLDQFGGASAAQMTTFGGQTKEVADSWEAFTAAVGAAIIENDELSVSMQSLIDVLRDERNIKGAAELLSVIVATGAQLAKIPGLARDANEAYRKLFQKHGGEFAQGRIAEQREREKQAFFDANPVLSGPTAVPGSFTPQDLDDIKMRVTPVIDWQSQSQPELPADLHNFLRGDDLPMAKAGDRAAESWARALEISGLAWADIKTRSEAAIETQRDWNEEVLKIFGDESRRDFTLELVDQAKLEDSRLGLVEFFTTATDMGEIATTTMQSFTSGIGNQLTSALLGAETSFEQFGKSVLDMLAQMIVQALIFKALSAALGGTKIGQALFGPDFETGGVFRSGGKENFASGGVVQRPTVFPMANGGIGLMAERGAEAIMPLRRDPSTGRLGVESVGASGEGQTVINVNVENSVPHSEENSEELGAAIARAVASSWRENALVQQRPGGLLNPMAR